MNRKQVYEAIDSERDYQEQKWAGNPHSFEDWITYIEDYTAEAKHLLTRPTGDDVVNRVVVSDILRKVAGLSVACLEQHGVRNR